MAWVASLLAFAYAISDKDPVVSVISWSAGLICLALGSIGEKVRKWTTDYPGLHGTTQYGTAGGVFTWPMPKVAKITSSYTTITMVHRMRMINESDTPNRWKKPCV